MAYPIQVPAIAHQRQNQETTANESPPDYELHGLTPPQDNDIEATASGEAETEDAAAQTTQQEVKVAQPNNRLPVAVLTSILLLSIAGLIGLFVWGLITLSKFRHCGSLNDDTLFGSRTAFTSAWTMIWMSAVLMGRRPAKRYIPSDIYTLATVTTCGLWWWFFFAMLELRSQKLCREEQAGG